MSTPSASGRHGTPRPTAADLDRARSRTVPDLLRPGLDVVFCGINPGLYTTAVGHHYARPGNRFWPALHRSGFTPRLLDPSEERLLLGWSIGLTNMVPRTTARADEITAEEYRAGGARLRATLAEFRPRWIGVVGLGAFRTAFGVPHARVGCWPEDIEGTHVWLLPSTSGLNAHWQPGPLAEEFARFRVAAGLPDRRAAERPGP